MFQLLRPRLARSSTRGSPGTPSPPLTVQLSAASLQRQTALLVQMARPQRASDASCMHRVSIRLESMLLHTLADAACCAWLAPPADCMAHYNVEKYVFLGLRRYHSRGAKSLHLHKMCVQRPGPRRKNRRRSGHFFLCCPKP